MGAGESDPMTRAKRISHLRAKRREAEQNAPAIWTLHFGQNGILNIVFSLSCDLASSAFIVLVGIVHAGMGRWGDRAVKPFGNGMDGITAAELAGRARRDHAAIGAEVGTFERYGAVALYRCFLFSYAHLSVFPRCAATAAMTHSFQLTPFKAAAARACRIKAPSTSLTTMSAASSMENIYAITNMHVKH